ncbi:HigA family addiction module antitoxin [Klebsiella pneumoniae]|uniref:HigA family addiction module antitoxin n=1 Tax=Klebsiella pneumoniae TaxID=573 RepID=UPI000F9B1FA7|nr:addiction module antidote protein, HigA family [Escherichia coli]MKS04624.1 addiction module antidote protein, HigA family [Escherichia coli]HBB8782501.1 HigA family addiction module antidote protein [Escherichia coli]HCO4404308.1 HigA family addiction module antidote protein [Escherichia coli]
MCGKKAEPSTAGEILNEEFLKPMNMSICKLAGLTGMSYSRIRKILIYHTPISLNEALLLAEILKTDADFWINLKNNHHDWQKKHYR